MGAAWLAMGLSPLILGAWILARSAFRVEPGPARVLASATILWAWITLGVEVLGTVGRLDPGPLVAWSVGALAVAALVAWVRPPVVPSVESAPSKPGSPGVVALLATALVLSAVIKMGMVSFFHPVKVVSDGPIYHLYIAARWWKAGRIFPVPTPFGELGATYFWANGELWYAWLMTLHGGDRFAKLGQGPFLLMGGLAVESIFRRLKVGAPAARIATLWFVSIGPAFILSFEPNVDCFLVAGYVTAIYFFLRAFTGPGGIGLNFLILGSLAAGLGMGTKPTGIVFFPPILVLVMGLIVGKLGRSWGRLPMFLGAAILPAVALMIYWPARNAWLTGNPLYPLHVEGFGRVWLSGWFGPGAMAYSPFYIARGNWRALVDILVAVLDPREVPLWVASALGVWALRRPRRVDPLDDRPTIDRWVWGLSALAAFNLAAYWLVIPYRTQHRFAFPAVALFSVPLAKLFDRAGWIRNLAAGLLVLHMLTPQAWPIAAKEAEIPWDLLPMIPNFLPSPIDFPTSLEGLAQQSRQPRFLAAVLLGVGSLAAVWGWRRPPEPKSNSRIWTRRALAVAVLAPCLVLAGYGLNLHVQVPFPLFQDYNAGWAELESRTGRGGARIAYAGNKIPYYLMGSKLQNDVQSVNIDAHRDWLLHDYHRNAALEGKPTTWPNPFPEWDRLRPDYDAWLANLRAKDIEILVVTRVNTDDGMQYAADRDLFTIERVWAETHPEVFRPIFGPGVPDPKIRIFQVLPPRKIGNIDGSRGEIALLKNKGGFLDRIGARVGTSLTPDSMR